MFRMLVYQVSPAVHSALRTLLLQKSSSHALVKYIRASRLGLSYQLS
jgi:hypothetical protein